MYCSICKNMIFELMYAAIGTNTGLSELFPKAKRFAVWFGKCTRQKGFIGQQKVQRRKEDYWKIAFQNQREIRQNGRIKYSMNGKWQGKPRCQFRELFVHLGHGKDTTLDTNIVSNMSAESLNLWLAKFIQEICKGNGQRCRGRTLYSMIWCVRVLPSLVVSSIIVQYC